jgi:hypothetical protein
MTNGFCDPLGRAILSSLLITGNNGRVLCIQRGLREADVFVDGSAEFVGEASDFLFTSPSNRAMTEGSDALA